jgi:signal transduction histidine kinase
MNNPARGRLFRKYVVVLLLLVGGVLIASSLVELYFSYRETQQSIVRVERAKAVAAATGIEQFLTEIEQQVRETTRLVSDDPDASQVGPVRLGFREGLGAALAEQRELDFLRILRNVPAVSQLTHLDLAGKEQLRVSRLDPDVVGSQEDFSRAPQFLEARTGKTYWSPVYLKNGSEPYVTLALPVGKYAVEVTTAEVNLGAVLKIVSQIEVGSDGYAYVVDSRNQLVAHPDGRVLRAKRDLSALVQVKAARAERADAGPDAPTAVVADGLGGERILAAHAPIAPQGWLVFVERPAAAAYAPLRAPIIRSVVIFVLGLGLSILASILLARRMVAPIRVLQEGAARIGAGDLAHRIDVRTGDELQTLGDELNRAATRLEESYASLERKVAERTHELTEALQRLTALSEVGRAISSTLDLQTVLNSIVVHAGPLAGADGCAIYEYDEHTQEFHLRATHNYAPTLVAAITASPLRKGEGVMGRAAERGEPIQIPDITQPGAYETRQRDVLVRAGFRALLSVPLLFEDRIIGSLSVNRKAPGEYSSDVIELLKTFATQSVLSLENARLFREIADQSRELEIASQHKSEFLANMSHELRTPLNAIIGFSEVLLERMFGEMNDKQTEYLHDIMGSGRHLLSLINDILDLSKVEAGRMELEPSEFHLPTALDDACTLVRERASRRNIVLRVTVNERIGEVRADERKIKQVMLNLLSNAVKFTPEGGRIEVRAVPSNGFSEVSVSDSGIGIAPEDQAVVFDEFRQVGTSAAKREGTGLGLALCRKFIELHGGKIWVESQVGVGSTFTFTIPADA